MKISLDMLYKNNAHRYAKVLYHKLNLQNIDLDHKEITVYDEESNIEFFHLLASTFNLTANILYKEYDDEIVDFYVFKNGLYTSYTTNYNGGHIRWFKYNDRRLLIYSESSDDNNEFYTYDDNGNKLSYETSRGYAEVYTYDNNRLVRYENTTSNIRIYNYNDQGLLIYSLLTTSDNLYKNESYYYYNEKGLLIKTVINNVEEVYEYDNNDLLICRRVGIYNEKFIYKNKLLIEVNHSHGYKEFYTYDINGNILSYEDSAGYKEIFINGVLTSVESNYNFTDYELMYDLKEIN